MNKTPSTRNRDPKTGRLIKGGGWGYKIKYIGKNKIPKYLINNEWVERHKIPEWKEHENSVERYFQLLYTKIKIRSKEHKEWSGEFDFEGGEDLLNHWNKQQEKYGNRCPITKKILTTVRGEGVTTMTNISPDRLFSPITYTKQNTLFTSTGWNLSKHSLKFYEMADNLKHENCQRHFKILHERFPEYEDIGWEAIDGYNWSVT